MNTIKCKYNRDEATVELLFSDGTKVVLLCNGIEADLSIGIETKCPQGGKPSEYAVMALNGTLQDYCDTIDRQAHTRSTSSTNGGRGFCRYFNSEKVTIYPLVICGKSQCNNGELMCGCSHI